MRGRKLRGSDRHGQRVHAEAMNAEIQAARDEARRAELRRDMIALALRSNRDSLSMQEAEDQLAEVAAPALRGVGVLRSIPDDDNPLAR